MYVFHSKNAETLPQKVSLLLLKELFTTGLMNLSLRQCHCQGRSNSAVTKENESLTEL
jgi:hypothetical protein